MPALVLSSMKDKGIKACCGPCFNKTVADATTTGKGRRRKEKPESGG